MTLFGIKGQAKGGPRWIYKRRTEDIVLDFRVGDKSQDRILVSEIGLLADIGLPIKASSIMCFRLKGQSGNSWFFQYKHLIFG